jgi:glycosyltransferase involved in cell wall biosynthesis
VPYHARVIYGGVETSLYLNENNRTPDDGTICLLCVGRLVSEKGIHTAIEALGLLVLEEGFNNLRLTIVGDGDCDYVAYLHRLVEQKNLGGYVEFVPVQSKEALPALYHQADIFLFTSIWGEPFGRVIVEAMASGCAVVGAPVGGAAEMLREGENALTFAPGDPQDLCRQIKRLVEFPSLRDRLRRAGRDTAQRKFDIQRMTLEIEACLNKLLS